MTKYHVRFKVNPNIPLMNPEQRVKFAIQALEQIKVEVDAKVISDWGFFTDASGGYAIWDTDKETLFAALFQERPYILCEVRPVLSVEESIEVLKKLAVTGK
jgi:hypothetical protein